MNQFQQKLFREQRASDIVRLKKIFDAMSPERLARFLVNEKTYLKLNPRCKSALLNIDVITSNYKLPIA